MSSIDIDQDNVKSISDKCHQLNELQSQLKEKEEAISKLKHKVRDMEERIIPEMMQEAGKLLGVRLTLNADAKEGITWAETH